MSWSERASIRLGTLMLASTLLVAGCGFHLRGTVDLPPVLSVTYVDSLDRHTYFRRELTQTLEDAGATVTEDRAQASAVVDISQDESGQQVLSVSARNVPEEFLVFYTVQYSVRAGGEQLVAPQVVSLRRAYAYDVTKVLAKSREEEILREALAKDIVSIVMQRLEAL